MLEETTSPESNASCLALPFMATSHITDVIVYDNNRAMICCRTYIVSPTGLLDVGSHVVCIARAQNYPPMIDANPALLISLPPKELCRTQISISMMYDTLYLHF